MAATFIVDINVGKVARWLRMMGYDTLLFTDRDDGNMIKIALQQNRIIVTRDGQIMQRRLVSGGTLNAILVKGDDSKKQLKQVAQILHLDFCFKPFSRCIRCNHLLVNRTREEVSGLVPSHVFQTQQQYMQCPGCLRIYWQGTHWASMRRELEHLIQDKTGGAIAK